jgi:hypothetical protein
MSTPAGPRRYDWEPLERLVRVPWITYGVDKRQIASYRAKGLTARRADELAVRAGWLPVEVWPEWGSDVLEAEQEARRKSARDSARRRYTERSDILRARSTRYRQENHAYVLRQQRAYRAENRDLVRAQQRDYYERNREAILARARARHAAKTRNEQPFDRSTGCPQGLASSDPQAVDLRIAPLQFDQEV